MDEILNIELYSDLKDIINQSRSLVTRNVNTIMLHTYWNIGRRIVEEEQKGKETSNYGDYIIKNLSKELTKIYGKGYSSTNLKMMRRLYN